MIKVIVLVTIVALIFASITLPNKIEAQSPCDSYQIGTSAWERCLFQGFLATVYLNDITTINPGKFLFNSELVGPVGPGGEHSIIIDTNSLLLNESIVITSIPDINGDKTIISKIPTNFSNELNPQPLPPKK